jgi:hypothetical protein
MALPETIAFWVGIGGGAIGAVGGVVSIVTAIRAGRREKWKEIEEQNDFSFLAAFMQKQYDVAERAGQIFVEIPVGSKEWQRAEKLVERKILERGPSGRGYRIVGFEDLKAKPFQRSPAKSAKEVIIERRNH